MNTKLKASEIHRRVRENIRQARVKRDELRTMSILDEDGETAYRAYMYERTGRRRTLDRSEIENIRKMWDKHKKELEDERLRDTYRRSMKK